jgi:hypothetical protein
MVVIGIESCAECAAIKERKIYVEGEAEWMCSQEDYRQIGFRVFEKLPPVPNWCPKRRAAADIKWQYEEERLEKAKDMGFGSIEEAFMSLYEKYQSTRIVGDLMGVSQTAVRVALTFLGVRLRGRGGRPKTYEMPADRKRILAEMDFDTWVKPSDLPSWKPSVTSDRLHRLCKSGYVEKFWMGDHYLYRKIRDA